MKSMITVETNEEGIETVDPPSQIYIDSGKGYVRFVSGTRVITSRESANDMSYLADLDNASAEDGANEVKKAHYILEGDGSLSSLFDNGALNQERMQTAGGIQDSDGNFTFTAINGDGDKINVTFEIRQVPDAKGNMSPMFVMTKVIDVEKVVEVDVVEVKPILTKSKRGGLKGVIDSFVGLFK